MPTFTRKNKPLKVKRRRRTFLRKVKKLNKPTNIIKTNKKETSNKKATITASEIKNNSGVNNADISSDTEAQKEVINRMIDTASSKLREMAMEIEETEEQIDEEPVSFDGISNDDERIRLLEEKLRAEQRLSAKMKHEMELIKADHEKEKKSLEKNVRNLRKEIRGSHPLDDTKFFSLSKELETAVEEIEKLVDNSGEINNKSNDDVELMLNEHESTSMMHDDKGDEHVTRIVKKPQNDDKQEVDTIKDENTDIKKPRNKGKKMLITGGAALAVVLILGGVLSATMFTTPKVNDDLVEEYLNKAEKGDVAGINSVDGNTETGQSEQMPSQSDELLDVKVPFEQTVWKEFKDPIFGITMNYPENAVKMMRTDSSTTFSRREGYIFRIQMVETGNDLMSYWNQIKATNYDYEVAESTFQGKRSLDLVLKEETDYPGNKILVKVGEVIYDIWYATPSDKFSEDDIKRVDEMKRSIVFNGEELEE